MHAPWTLHGVRAYSIYEKWTNAKRSLTGRRFESKNRRERFAATPGAHDRRDGWLDTLPWTLRVSSGHASTTGERPLR